MKLIVARQWLARGTVLPDGSKVKKLIAYAENWQIFSTNFAGFALLVKPDLYEKWCATGFVVPTVFEKVIVGSLTFFSFTCKSGYIISSVQYGPYPHTYLEAQALAIALKETRKINSTVSLQDSIYIESISRILPTYSLSERLDDKTVLGKWLTGGVAISTDSFRRLCQLMEWMDSKAVVEIINKAGFEVRNGDYLAKKRTLEEYGDNSLESSERKHLSLKKERFFLPGRPELEEFFNEHVIEIINNEEKYKRMGIDFPSAVVLYGPPGCGKTYAVEKLVEFLDWPQYSIDSGSVGSPYIHDTSKKISAVFDSAIENAPSVIIIDEMEAFLTDRQVGMSSGIHHVEEVAEFLRRIPEATHNRVLVIAMTNMLDMIDSAILRRGRFDHIIEVKMPSPLEIKLLLENMFSKLPVTQDLNIQALSQKLSGRPISDVAYVVKEAGRNAVKADKEFIDNEAIELAVKALPEAAKNRQKIGFH